MPYQAWQPLQGPPWLQGQFGAAWLSAFGSLKDDEVDLLRQAVLSAFPAYAPADALPVIGDELQLDRGPKETDPGYAGRITDPWTQWARAGSPLGILLALHYGNFDGAVLVQQNGLAFSLSAPPTDGVDPTSLLTVTTLGELATPLTPYPTPDYTKVIPAGNPWWTFDFKTDFCSRFAVLFPSGGSAFTTWGTAVFDGSSPTATITWNNPFPSSSYVVQIGAITNTGDPVEVNPDATTQTTTGITLQASAPFTGTVDVLAYQSGAESPFADLHPADLARLQGIVKKWRPAKATCVGVYVLVQGRYWGWPVKKWGDAGLKWGPSAVVSVPGSWV